jgi:hypothetical protein
MASATRSKFNEAIENYREAYAPLSVPTTGLPRVRSCNCLPRSGHGRPTAYPDLRSTNWETDGGTLDDFLVVTGLVEYQRRAC